MSVQLFLREASRDPLARSQIARAVDDMPFHMRVIAGLSDVQMVTAAEDEDGAFVLGVGVNHNARRPRP